MQADGHPLAHLIGPLRYACEDNFARLAQVRGLRQLVEGAFASAREQGVVRDSGAALRRFFDDIDASSLDKRKKALCEILEGLRRIGVELPESLSQVLAPSSSTPEPRTMVNPALIPAPPAPRKRTVKAGYASRGAVVIDCSADRAIGEFSAQCWAPSESTTNCRAESARPSQVGRCALSPAALL
jgi:ATP-dependent DNA helicase RecG